MNNLLICNDMKLVTGATGFLGAHLVADLLEKGYEIKALKRDSSDMHEFNLIMSVRFGKNFQFYQDQLTWISGDILDFGSLLEALQGVDQVFHAAAIVSFWPKHYKEMYKTNVGGTANVVNACLQMGVQSLIYVSSIAAIGRGSSNATITEEQEWVDSPYNSQYAVSKYLAELEVWRGKEEGLNIAIVNPGVIIGEGNPKKGSCKLLATAFKGSFFYTDGVNGYVDVRDVSHTMVHLAERRIWGRRFILVGENLSILELFNTASKYKLVKTPKLKVRRWMLEIVWRVWAIWALISRKEPLITKETALTSLKVSRYDAALILSIIPWELKSVSKTLSRVAKSGIY